MGTTSRRGFLKGIGVTLSAVGLSTASGPASAPVILPSQTGGTRRRRATLTPDALEILVAEQLRMWVAQARQFTAYDVTRALRQARPGVNVVHARVRPIVHLFMASAVASEIYTCAPVNVPAGWAWLYSASPA